MPPKLGLAELVKVFPTRGGVVRVVHRHVVGGIAAVPRDLEVATVASFQDINLRVVNLWVRVVVHCSILGAKMLSAGERSVSERRRSSVNVQSRCALSAKLAMEDQDRFPGVVATSRRPGFGETGSKQKLFDGGCRVNIDRALDVSTSILIVKAAVDDMIVVNGVVILAIQKLVQLHEDE